MEYNIINEAPHPVYAADRIKTIDMIRGVASLGILLMNIPGFGLHWSNYPAIMKGPVENADFKTLRIISTFFEGTMRGLFSMLFGAGMILFTMNKKDKPQGATVAEYYYRRLLWLVLFGMFNAYILLWNGDILYFYGLAGMLLYPFRNAGVKWLIALSVLCLGIGALKQIPWYTQLRENRIGYLEAVKAEKAKKKLTKKQEEAKTAWLNAEKWQKPDTAMVNSEVKKMHGDYASVFSFKLPINSNDETWGIYHGLWDSLTMMFLGMALLYLGYFSNQCSTSTYWMGLILGYGVGIILGWLMFEKGWHDWMVNMGRYVDRYWLDNQILYDFKRVFLSVGHASLVILVYRSKLLPWLMQALASVGQMAFSNYLMQSIFCTLYFNGYGLDHYNDLRYYQLYYVVFSIWIFQLIFSSIWLKYFRFGPFEWLWRSLTYWKLQPFKV